jgi:hypothetical protein
LTGAAGSAGPSNTDEAIRTAPWHATYKVIEDVETIEKEPLAGDPHGMSRYDMKILQNWTMVQWLRCSAEPPSALIGALACCPTPSEVLKFALALGRLYSLPIPTVDLLEEMYDETAWEETIGTITDRMTKEEAEQSAGVQAVKGLAEEDKEVWESYKKKNHLRLDLPSAIRMLIHHQLSRCWDDRKRLQRRLEKTYGDERERERDEKEFARSLSLTAHLKKKYPTRLYEKEFFDRLVFRDPRFIKEREAGETFEVARKKYRSRLRSQRHESAQRNMAAGFRSATEVTRAELDTARDREQEPRAAWVEEDPRNEFTATARQFTQREKDAMRLDEELWKTKPIPGERVLRRLLAQAVVLCCRPTNSMMGKSRLKETHGTVGADCEFVRDDFDVKDRRRPARVSRT